MKNNNSIIESKNFYNRQICSKLNDNLYKGLLYIWSTCKTSKKPLYLFQKKLETIYTWSDLILDNEVDRITKHVKLHVLEKILEAIFIAYSKILSSLRVSNTQKTSIDIKVPSVNKFIHMCYINCYREFYMCPYLFSDTKIDQEKKMYGTVSEDTLKQYHKNIKRIRFKYEKINK